MEVTWSIIYNRYLTVIFHAKYQSYWCWYLTLPDVTKTGKHLIYWAFNFNLSYLFLLVIIYNLFIFFKRCYRVHCLSNSVAISFMMVQYHHHPPQELENREVKKIKKKSHEALVTLLLLVRHLVLTRKFNEVI
jgi:hypothetical protein